MRKVSECLNHWPTEQSGNVMPFESKRETSSITQAVIDRFFERMIELYDYDWTNRYGGSADIYGESIWVKVLKQLTKAEIAKGLEILISPSTPHAKVPPKPLEFRNMAKDITDSRFRTHHAAYKLFPPALPKPINNPNLVSGEIAKMRRAISGAA